MGLLLALVLVGCAADGLDGAPPDEPAPPQHAVTPCELKQSFRFVPNDGRAYEVDAAPDTILTGCSDGSGLIAQPYDVVVAPFPDGGPDAEAIVSVKLPPGGCYELVICANDAQAPTVYPL